MQETEINIGDWEKINELTSSLDFGKMKEMLPEEYKSTLEPIKNMGGLLSSFVNAQKMIGGKPTVFVPDDKSNPEQLKEFYNKLGVPDSPDGYKLNPGEMKVSDDVIKSIKSTFAETKMTNKQAEAVFKKMMDLEKTNYEQSTAEIKAKLDSEAKTWTNEMADKVTEADNKIEAVLKKYPDAAKIIQEYGVEKFAAVRKMLNDLSGSVQNDDPNRTGDKAVNTKSNETPRESLARLRVDKEFMKKYHGYDKRVSDAEHEDAKRIFTSLHEAANKA